MVLCFVIFRMWQLPLDHVSHDSCEKPNNAVMRCHGNSHVPGGDMIVEVECLGERQVAILHVVGPTDLSCPVHPRLYMTSFEVNYSYSL